MDDEDRGWPLEKEAIRAKYYALVKKDMERKVLKASKAKSKNLAYDHMLQQIPVHLSKSKSTREAYSRARSLQRVLRRAGLADTSGKGSQSVPVPSPSESVEPDSGATSSMSHQSRLEKNHGHVTPHVQQLATGPNVVSNGNSRLQKNGKQTKFLAKQFKLISNNANTTPRRNIKILAKETTSEVIFVAETMERDQLQERIRVHDSDKPDPSNLGGSSSLSGPRKMGRYIIDLNAHANSPSSVVSEALSVPETVMSSVENGELSTDHRKLTSFSITRERWTSREIFGSFDFGGELDIIAGTVAEATRYPESSGYYDHDRFNSCLDESLNSPSSGMRSPRQSYATSSQGGVTDPDHHYYRRGTVEHCTRRMKVTSPSSLFRDGPQSSPGNVPRKLSRKLSTSFNKRRKQQPGMTTVQSHQAESLSTRSTPDKKTTLDHEKSSKGNLTLQIAGLVSGYRLSQGYGKGAMQEAAVNAFQDEIAQLMMDRSESNEIADIEEFLDGYMRLRSPFYLEVVEEFFRTVSYDCYKRPLEVKKRAPKVPKVPKVIRH